MIRRIRQRPRTEKRARADGRGRPRAVPKHCIKAYLEPELHRRWFEHCASRGLTVTETIHLAIQRYLEPTDEVALLHRRMDRAARATERVHRELELLAEAFSVFAQLWFAHAPVTPPDMREAARRTSAARYKQFVDRIGEQFANGHRFFDDLPKEAIADEDELMAIAKAAANPSPSSVDGQ
jgi:hypothetical protein